MRFVRCEGSGVSNSSGVLAHEPEECGGEADIDEYIGKPNCGLLTAGFPLTANGPNIDRSSNIE